MQLWIIKDTFIKKNWARKKKKNADMTPTAQKVYMEYKQALTILFLTLGMPLPDHLHVHSLMFYPFFPSCSYVFDKSPWYIFGYTIA